MKKIFIFTFIVILCFAMIGCGNGHNIETNPNDIITLENSRGNNDYGDLKGDKQDYFNAKVLAIGDSYIKVKCLDVTKGNIIEGTEVEVAKDIVSAKGIPDIKINDTVRIVYTGIMENYPIRLKTVFAIYKVDDKGNVMP